MGGSNCIFQAVSVLERIRTWRFCKKLLVDARQSRDAVLSRFLGSAARVRGTWADVGRNVWVRAGSVPGGPSAQLGLLGELGGRVEDGSIGATETEKDKPKRPEPKSKT